MMNPDETMRMLQELTVYKIELELQNEQLRHSHGELETALARYTDLYVFSPVAYFTTDQRGLISETNLAGAGLVGSDRSQISGKSFLSFVDSADQARFQTFLANVFGSEEKQTCDVVLAQNARAHVQIVAKATPGVSQAHLVVMETANPGS